MFWSDPQILGLCQEIKRAGLALPLEPGCKVARGFADLGFEEFLVTAQHQLISLFTGKLSALPPGHEQHFFAVPTPDQALAELQKRGYELVRSEYVDQRSWMLEVKNESGSVTSKAVDIEAAFIGLLWKISGAAHVPA